MHRFTPFLISLLVAGGAANAATDYPTRAVTVIVPHAAGGPTDTVSRLVAESMTRTLGQPVIVENAGGAGSTVGTARAARAEPDGYTLLINHVAQATSAALYRKLAYDPDGAFDGIGLITDVPMTLVAKADFAPSTIGELLDYIRAREGQRHLRPRRRRLGLASVRHAADGRARRVDDDRVLQGHRAGDDRPSGRPGRHDVRPDHQHGRPRSRPARSRATR